MRQKEGEESTMTGFWVTYKCSQDGLEINNIIPVEGAIVEGRKLICRWGGSWICTLRSSEPLHATKLAIGCQNSLFSVELKVIKVKYVCCAGIIKNLGAFLRVKPEEQKWKYKTWILVLPLSLSKQTHYSTWIMSPLILSCDFMLKGTLVCFLLNCEILHFYCFSLAP